MSVRDDPVLFLQPGKNGNSSGSGSVLGGSAVTVTSPHRLDGPEHLEAIDSNRLDATTAQHGLLPKLSGDADDAFRGDGTWAPASSSSSGFVPYFVAADDTWTLPEFYQVTYATPIDNEGTLDIEGILVEVD